MEFVHITPRILDSKTLIGKFFYQIENQYAKFANVSTINILHYTVKVATIAKKNSSNNIGYNSKQ